MVIEKFRTNDVRMEIGSKKWKQLIIDGAARFGINIDAKKTEQFAVHADELIKWNRKINLTAIKTPEDIAVKHFVDSIMPSRWITPGARLLDIGSGGGFPGIPLKILMPSLSVLLIDASRKKVSFLKHVIRTLKLIDIEACQLRAEDLAKQSIAFNSFDIIISRALTSIENFMTMATPLLAENGVIIAMKGTSPFKEIETFHLQSQKDIVYLEINNIKHGVKLEKYILPYQKSQRSIVLINSGGCYEI